MGRQMTGISTKGMGREEWLALRRTGIGGSDAAAVLGRSRWAGPLSVYLDKRGEAPERRVTEAMRQGTDLEEAVASRFERESGLRVRRCNRILRSAEHPFMLANIDRRVAKQGCFVGLECKTTGMWSPTEHAAGEIAPEHYWQCVHYMAVTGAPRWELAVLVFSRGFYRFTLQRNEDDIRTLIEAEARFWNDHVLAGKPPLPNGTDADGEAVDALNAAAPEKAERTLTREDAGHIAVLEQLKAERKALDGRIRAEQQCVEACMAGAERASGEGWRVSLLPQTRETLDSARLRKEQPELYRSYARSSVSRVLRITGEGR